MIGDFLKAVVKDVVLTPVKIVEGVADAVDSLSDPPPKKKP